MPSTLSYPGVYIEEIPSGVRTITGVPTSVAAFVGRALRGPTDEAVVINSYGDFERIFGGLWVDSTLGFAVRDFYLNSGGKAIIVRLYNVSAADEAQAPPIPVKTQLSVDALTLAMRPERACVDLFHSSMASSTLSG